MARSLLDTDAVLDYLNRHPPTVSLVEALVAQGDPLCTCDIVLAEVHAGLYPHDEERASGFLPTLEFLAASPAASERAGRWRYQFAHRGGQLPVTDALIAGTAVEHTATIVTGNVRDYPMPEVSVVSVWQ
jgi:predicted nucleic acid-binding protein